MIGVVLSRLYSCILFITISLLAFLPGTAPRIQTKLGDISRSSTFHSNGMHPSSNYYEPNTLQCYHVCYYGNKFMCYLTPLFPFFKKRSRRVLINTTLISPPIITILDLPLKALNFQQIEACKCANCSNRFNTVLM